MGAAVLTHNPRDNSKEQLTQDTRKEINTASHRRHAPDRLEVNRKIIRCAERHANQEKHNKAAGPDSSLADHREGNHSRVTFAILPH